MDRICQFNSYVCCEEMNRCANCGWNPTVHAKRLEKRKGGFNDDRSEHHNEACEAHPGK